MADLGILQSSLLVGVTGLDTDGAETNPLVVNADGSINVLQVAGENIKVSSNDQTTGYLQQKIIGTTDKVTVTVQDEGNDEKLVVGLSSNIFDKTVDTATQVVNTPSGGIAATNVQAAINELDSEKANKTTTISAGAGLTGGGDLSANRTLAVNLAYNDVSATNTITTTSATDTLMTGMTLTPVAGNYLVLFSASLRGGNDDSSITGSIYAGGTFQAGSQRQVVANVSGGLSNPNTNTVSITSFSVVTVNGSQAIEGRWRRASGTATASYRHLKIIRIG